MYFKQLSLDTLNESNQWNILSEVDYRDMARHVSGREGILKQLVDVGSSVGNSVGNWIKNSTPPKLDTAEKITTQMYPQTQIPITGSGGGIPGGTIDLSKNGGTISQFWNGFANFIGQAYEKGSWLDENFPQLASWLRQNPNVAPGTIAGSGGAGLGGILWKYLSPIFGGGKSEPEQVINNTSDLGTYTMYGAAAAGILGTIWLIKRWLKNRTFDKQSVEYAAKLNQMKPEDIPEEDKDKPIEA